jgi:Ni/Co efflux regulator RcnB
MVLTPQAEREFAMKRSMLAVAAVLLLSGAASGTAFAQDARYAYPDPLYANGDADNDSIPNADDPVDNRYDEAGNPVRFEVGEALPPDSYGNATEIEASQYRLHPPGAGQTWHHLGHNAYLVEPDGRIVDAVYNLQD